MHNVVEGCGEMWLYCFQAQQLSQKRVVPPPLEAIYLTEDEVRLLQNKHQRRLQEIVQKHCTTIIKNLMMYKVGKVGVGGLELQS